MSDESKHTLISMLSTEIQHVDDNILTLNKLPHDCAPKCLKWVASGRKNNSKAFVDISCNRLKLEVRPLAKSVCTEPDNIHLKVTVLTAKQNLRKWKNNLQ